MFLQSTTLDDSVPPVVTVSDRDNGGRQNFAHRSEGLQAHASTNSGGAQKAAVLNRVGASKIIHSSTEAVAKN